MSFLNPQGPIAAAERTHFFVVLGILVVFVAVPVFLLTPWLVWRYRHGTTNVPYRPKWKANRALEIMTWTGPFIIVIVLGVLVWRDSHRLDPYRPIAPQARAVQVQAIGYDWKWLFVYPEQGIATVGVLVVPVGKPVSMRLTSATVMQSLHIPALVSQIYAMGGMVTQLHFKASRTGRSLGENNMYNGDGFHHQKFTALAMPAANFQAWVDQVRATGVPLDADIYQLLTQQNNVATLVKALPDAAHHGHIYLSRASSTLFPAVVNATITGKPVNLSHVLANATPPPANRAGQSTSTATESSP